jgi:hypothetical protein
MNLGADRPPAQPEATPPWLRAAIITAHLHRRKRKRKLLVGGQKIFAIFLSADQQFRARFSHVWMWRKNNDL